MKLSTVIAASAATYASAQELTRCGNHAPAEELQSKLNEAVELFANSRDNGTGAAAGAVDTYVHVVTTSAKEGTYSQQQIEEQVCSAQQIYQNSKLITRP